MKFHFDKIQKIVITSLCNYFTQHMLPFNAFLISIGMLFLIKFDVLDTKPSPTEVKIASFDCDIKPVGIPESVGISRGINMRSMYREIDKEQFYNCPHQSVAKTSLSIVFKLHTLRITLNSIIKT